MTELNNDGHDYLNEVVKRGIRNLIVEKDVSVPNANILMVKSSIKALQNIAAYHRKKFTYPIVGITGSNGKTIVKEWLSEIISEEFKVVKSPKSYNSQVGVPLSVLEMGDHDVGVFEAGLSKGGEMQNLADVIQPTIGIFTTIGEAHALGFESRIQKMKEKAKFFASCNIVICRKEHEMAVKEISKVNPKIFTWSTQNNTADVFFELKNHSVTIDRYNLTLDTPFWNEIQRENIFHSIVCAKEIGISNEAIKKSVRHLRSVPMRMQLKKAVNGCQLIDDSYNNDLMGLETALDFMNEVNFHQPKTVIISDIYQSNLTDEELNIRLQQMLITKQVDRTIQIGSKLDLSEERYSDTRDFLNRMPNFSNETILLKGARSFKFEKIAERLEAKNHSTTLEINLEAIRRNLNVYRAAIGNTKLMVMVKALAYGAGAVQIAHLLQYEGVDSLGVAYLDEAIELRENGITLPIMIMNPEFPDFSLFEKYNLEAEIFSLESLEHFLESGSKVGIHLKIETGMNRLGFQESELDSLITILEKNPQLSISGIFTHFSSSDAPEEDLYTHLQAKKFNDAYNKLANQIGFQPTKHAVNSWGIVRFPEYHFDMVRLGIGLYGYYPEKLLKVESISELKTHITQIKTLKKGDSVGYSRQGRVAQDSKIAIIPIGYADGYRRDFGNGNAWVSINGQKARTIGNICMDMTMIDVTGFNVQVHDEVTVFGESPSIGQLAKYANTIPYEILTNVSDRVKRIFVSS